MADDGTPDLDDLLERISVMSPGQLEPDIDHGTADHPRGWRGVVNEYGVIAYFGDENEAFRYRLDLINRRLNG